MWGRTRVRSRRPPSERHGPPCGQLAASLTGDGLFHHSGYLRGEGRGGGGGRWVVGGILGLSRGKGRVRGRGKSIAGICEVRDRGDAGGEEASWERSAGPGRCVGHIGCILPGRCLVRILCVSTSTQVRLALRSHPAQEDAAPPGCPPPTLSHTHGQSASWSSTDTSVPDRPARFPTLTPSPYTPDRPAP